MTRPGEHPRAGSWLLVLSLLVWTGLAAPPARAVPPAAADLRPALRLEAGSLARRQMVGVGRDVMVEGRALQDVVSLSGDVMVSGNVEGDVIALGGSIELAETARVTGDVFAVGGTVTAHPGAELQGRSVSYPDASAAWMTLMEGPAVGLSPFSPLVLGAKLTLLATWMLLVLLFFGISGREVLSTSDAVAREPFRGFFVGLTGVVTLVLTALLFTALAAALVGLPLLVLVILTALVLKLWGMVAVFHALGDWLARKLDRPRLAPLHAATLGLLALGLLKFIPYVGLWAWTVATLIGVGAALSTKMGRREPWFQGV
jgi:hypothetical protein